MKTSIRAILFLFIFLMLQVNLTQSAGNDQTLSLSPEDRLAIEKYLGKGVVGEAIPAPELVNTHSYLAPHAGVRNYRHVSGPYTGKTEHHQATLVKQESSGATWRYDTGDRFIFLVNVKDDGDYLLATVTDNEEGVITHYSPGQPFMLQGLKPGEKRNMKLNLRVFDSSNPDKLTHLGSMDIIYHYIGAFKVTVPAGSFDAVLIKWDFKGKIGPATLDDTQYRFFVKDIGMVAAIEQMDVSAMLVYNKQRKLARVLIDKPKS